MFGSMIPVTRLSSCWGVPSRDAAWTAPCIVPTLDTMAPGS